MELLGSIQRQTVHWIGAQFGVFTSLESRDIPLNALKLCRNGQRNEQKKEQRERLCC